MSVLKAHIEKISIQMPNLLCRLVRQCTLQGQVLLKKVGQLEVLQTKTTSSKHRFRGLNDKLSK